MCSRLWSVWQAAYSCSAKAIPNVKEQGSQPATGGKIDQVGDVESLLHEGQTIQSRIPQNEPKGRRIAIWLVVLKALLVEAMSGPAGPSGLHGM